MFLGVARCHCTYSKLITCIHEHICVEPCHAVLCSLVVVTRSSMAWRGSRLFICLFVVPCPTLFSGLYEHSISCHHLLSCFGFPCIELHRVISYVVYNPCSFLHFQQTSPQVLNFFSCNVGQHELYILHIQTL